MFAVLFSEELLVIASGIITSSPAEISRGILGCNTRGRRDSKTIFADPSLPSKVWAKAVAVKLVTESLKSKTASALPSSVMMKGFQQRVSEKSVRSSGLSPCVLSWANSRTTMGDISTCARNCRSGAAAAPAGLANPFCLSSCSAFFMNIPAWGARCCS